MPNRASLDPPPPDHSIQRIIIYFISPSPKISPATTHHHSSSPPPPTPRHTTSSPDPAQQPQIHSLDSSLSPHTSPTPAPPSASDHFPPGQRSSGSAILGAQRRCISHTWLTLLVGLRGIGGMTDRAGRMLRRNLCGLPRRGREIRCRRGRRCRMVGEGRGRGGGGIGRYCRETCLGL